VVLDCGEVPVIDDPLSLLSFAIWLSALGMYPLALMLGSSCSPCCNQCGINNTSITTVSVEIEASDYLVHQTQRIDVGGGDFATELTSFAASYANLNGTFLLDQDTFDLAPNLTRAWVLNIAQDDGCTPARPYGLLFLLANDLSQEPLFRSFQNNQPVNWRLKVDDILWKSRTEREFDSGLFSCDPPAFYDYRGSNFLELPCVSGQTDCFKNRFNSVAWQWEQTCNPSNGNLTILANSFESGFTPSFLLATDYPAGSFIDTRSETVSGSEFLVLKSVNLS